MGVKIREITGVIESAAPLSLQEGYDNSGLLVGDPQQEVSSALICVDITEDVIREAIDRKAGLVISHHPVIFKPLKSITGSTYIERVVRTAIKHDIALYASHTNLDAAPGGMSFRAGMMLGVNQMETLTVDPVNQESGFGIIGSIEPEDTVSFIQRLKHTFGVNCLRHSRLLFDSVSKIALCTGAGSSLTPDAISRGAHIYIASEFRYNDFLDAADRIIIADIGHFESEYCAIDLLYEIIRKKIPNFALCKSENSRNPVIYS